jgi:S1-C subfamily serine protease
MKRTILVAVAVVAVLLVACTRTVVVRQPAGTSSTTASNLQANVGTSSDRIVQVVRAVRPAIVNVTTNTVSPSFFGGQPGKGVGTGFIVRPDGIIVTNYHVVEGAQKITVITPSPDVQRYDARVIGGDATADLAVLKIDAQGLPTVPLGNSSTLQLGQRVVAIGYALALQGGPTVTSGIVSALGRTIQAADPHCQVCNNGQRTYTNVIKTDAAINPGNSGGPLVNLAGQVVGINTAGTQSAENIGFAISINSATPTIEHAESNPSAPVAYLGVSTGDVTQSAALQFNLPVDRGAYVVELATGGPAKQAGIRVGDVIVGFDGQTVTSSDQLRTLIRDHSSGDRVSVVVVSSGGSRRTVEVTLGTNPLPQG